MHCSLRLLATLGLYLSAARLRWTHVQNSANAANQLNLSDERDCGEFGYSVDSKRVEFRVQLGG
jgi:hypothetical protein